MIRTRIKEIKDNIFRISQKDICIMEVCGTHTMSIAKHGIRSLLPSNIRIISGPGCPVCVTPSGEIGSAIELAKDDKFIIATFGDMLRVPSDGDFLQNYKNVKIIYSPLDSLELANKNPKKEIVLLGIGFETTAPLIGSTIKIAAQKDIDNFSVLCMHKIVPPAIEAILNGGVSKDMGGLILPGHVSVITGRKYFDFIKAYRMSGVISGFEAEDVLESIYLLVKFHETGECQIVNNYMSVVSEEGNKAALGITEDVFEICDSTWRGIGVISNSGLRIRDKYKKHDVVSKFNLKVKNIDDPKGCLCGQILMGISIPKDCGYFGKDCTPSDPVGPCMVSSEGTCAAHYKYGL
jgi:hydrogenase expression/formation protein HypD